MVDYYELDQRIDQLDHQGINDMSKVIMGVALLLSLQACSLQQSCPCPGIVPMSKAMQKHLQEKPHKNLNYCHRHKQDGKRHCHRHQ